MQQSISDRQDGVIGALSGLTSNTGALAAIGGVSLVAFNSREQILDAIIPPINTITNLVGKLGIYIYVIKINIILLQNIIKY